MNATVKVEKIIELSTRKKRILAVSIINGTVNSGMFIKSRNLDNDLKIESIELIDSDNPYVGLIFSEKSDKNLLHNIQVGDILLCYQSQNQV
ncbi:hypothetical protein WBJ53_24090 [Spirosoma sp. SC4-14]|uniref:hypothetical protein n=1 Tax=Spirosoma sp. SC4-14 TaxID=3128900 RepID=UPI0030D299AE